MEFDYLYEDCLYCTIAMKSIDKYNTIFLLGGHDLEMCTIKAILKQEGYLYVDKGLKWDNAYMSNYKDDITMFLEGHPSGTIYGIELADDIVHDTWKYESLDHHNWRSNEPSALEQVLSLLGLPLSRYYRLIAANDKHYIDGMLETGATDEEISMIRKEDRKAQGVTEEDEYLAEKSISENMERTGNLIIIRSYTSSFSPICDRLYPYDSLLVYTSTEFTCYGAEVMKAREILADEYAKGKVYYGGGKNGYVGSKKGEYTETEIKKIITTLKNELS